MVCAQSSIHNTADSEALPQKDRLSSLVGGTSGLALCPWWACLSKFPLWLRCPGDFLCKGGWQCHNDTAILPLGPAIGSPGLRHITIYAFAKKPSSISNHPQSRNLTFLLNLHSSWPSPPCSRWPASTWPRKCPRRWSSSSSKTWDCRGIVCFLFSLWN